MEHVGQEMMAAFAARAVATRAEAFTWCLVSRGFSDSFARFQLWGQVLATVAWPPSARRTFILQAFERLGSHCRFLSVDGYRGGNEDLVTLARLCPQISAVEIEGVDVRGLNADAWRLWSRSLRQLSLSFFYSSIDGAPPLKEVLKDVVESCQELEHLVVQGIDWNKARESCLEVLTEQRTSAPRLRKLELRGSEAKLSPGSADGLRRARPGIVISTTMRATPNLDW